MAGGVGQSQQNLQLMLQGVQQLGSAFDELRRRAEVNYNAAMAPIADEVKTGYGGSWKAYLKVAGNRDSLHQFASSIMGDSKAKYLIQGLESGDMSAEELHQIAQKEVANRVVEAVTSGGKTQGGNQQNASATTPVAQGQPATISLPGVTVGPQGTPQPAGPSARNLGGTDTTRTRAEYTGAPPLSPGDARSIAPGALPPGAPPSPGDTRTISQPPPGSFTAGGTTTRTGVNDTTVAPPSAPSGATTIDTRGNVDEVAPIIDKQIAENIGFDPNAMPRQGDGAVVIKNGKPVFDAQAYDKSHGAGSSDRLIAQLKTRGTTIDAVVQNRFNAIEAAKRGEPSYTLTAPGQDVNANLPGGGASSGASMSGGSRSSGTSAAAGLAQGFKDFQKQMFGSEEAARLANDPGTNLSPREDVIKARAIAHGTSWAINTIRKAQKNGEYDSIPDDVITNILNGAQVGPNPQDNSIAGGVYSGLTPAQQTQFMEAKDQYQKSLSRQDAQLYLQAKQMDNETWWRMAQAQASEAVAAAKDNPNLKALLSSYDATVQATMDDLMKKYPGDPKRVNYEFQLFLAENPNSAVALAWNGRTKVISQMAPENTRPMVQEVMNDGRFMFFRNPSRAGDIVQPTVVFPGMGGGKESDAAAAAYTQKYKGTR